MGYDLLHGPLSLDRLDCDLRFQRSAVLLLLSLHLPVEAAILYLSGLSSFLGAALFGLTLGKPLPLPGFCAKLCL